MKPILSILLLAAGLHAQGGAVDGKVVSAIDASPLRKATVLLRATAADRENYLTRTDSDGRFSIAGVAPGNYECVASRAGFGAAAPDRFATAAIVPRIAVRNGRRVADVVLRLTPLGAIAGRVLDADGYPVSSASVTALHYGYQQGRKVPLTTQFVQSDDRGEYRLFDLFPGTYFVRANKLASRGLPGARGLPDFWATYYPAALEAAQATAVEVTAGGETRSIDIRLQTLKVFSIRGKRPGNESPLRMNGFDFTALKRPADSAFSDSYSVSLGNGTWLVQDVPPGSYVMRMTATDPSSGAHQMAQALVDVIDADVDGVELTFTPEPEISGAVTFAGTPAVALDRLRVALMHVEGGQGPFAQVKADGTFQLGSVYPMVYRIAVEPADKVYPKSIKLGGRELSGRLLDLTGASGGALSIVVASDFGMVQGKVTDADGNPAVAHNVTLIPDQSKADWERWYKETFTDTEGRFAMRGVAPGEYTAFAWQDAPRGAAQNAEFRRPFEPLGQPITVDPGSGQTLELKAIMSGK